LRALVFRVGPCSEQLEAHRPGASGLRGSLLEGAAMRLEGPDKSLDRREQPLLQVHQDKALRHALAGWKSLEPLISLLPVFVQERRELELRRIRGHAVEVNFDDRAQREAAGDLPKVCLEAAYHHLVAKLGLNLCAADKTLGIEDLEQSGEAVR